MGLTILVVTLERWEILKQRKLVKWFVKPQQAVIFGPSMQSMITASPKEMIMDEFHLQIPSLVQKSVTELLRRQELVVMQGEMVKCT